MEDVYKIDNSNFRNPPPEYSDRDIYPDFQIKLQEFKSLLKKQVEENQGVSYYKFGDGDYFFLKKIYCVLLSVLKYTSIILLSLDNSSPVPCHAISPSSIKYM